MVRIFGIILVTGLGWSFGAWADEPANNDTPVVPPEMIVELTRDTMEGRGIGTKGLERARDLIKDKFKDLELAPAFPDKKFFQDLRVFTRNRLGERNNFGSSTVENFVPLSYSLSGSLPSTKLTFVGYGITLKEGKRVRYDDYAKVNVKNRIVVAMLGDPGLGAPISIFRDPKYHHLSSAIYKVKNALLHGAKGVILVRSPLEIGEGQPEPKLVFSERAGGGAVFDILAGRISIEYCNTLLGQKKLLAIQKSIARAQKPMSYNLNQSVEFNVTLEREVGVVQNVAAALPGTIPELANQYIVVGAHYDHLGLGGESSMDPSGPGKFHPGADDNASGVAAILKLAKTFKGKNRRPMLFVLFTAEEVGLMGSTHFAKNLPLPAGAKVVAMLNLDMIGRLAKNKLTVTGVNSAYEFSTLVNNINRTAEFKLSIGGSSLGSSDHASFLREKIPSLFLTTGAHGDYHRSTDTTKKINVEGYNRVLAFASELIARLDRQFSPPTYDPSSATNNQPPRTGRGYGAYFGSIPDFGGTPNSGVLLQGVKPDSPAMKAGLQAGDTLVGLGEIGIKNLHDFVFALRFYRPNDEVEVRWLRGSTPMRAKTTLRLRTAGH